MFDVVPEDQYTLTKAALCHEAGHRRFTTPTYLPDHVFIVSNILEDERIERLMEQEFLGVRELLKKLNKELLVEVEPLNPESDEPEQVLNYILQLRWSRRCGIPVRGTLSSKNWERWDDVSYLVQEAWSADSSEVCDRNAGEILRVLGIGEKEVPEWLKILVEKLEVFEGRRSGGDKVERAAPKEEISLDGTIGLPRPFDGEPIPQDGNVGCEAHIIEPKPYLELMERVHSLASRLVEELSLEISTPLVEASERGGRLSVRQHLREPERPFMSVLDESPPPPTMTFRLIIDHSTSMDHEDRIEYAAQAAMMLHLAGVEMGIPHEIAIAPDDIRIANLDSGEMGLALIAGMVPAQTGYEDTGFAVSLHGNELACMSEGIKLVMVVHDGMGNDFQRLTQECQRLRDRVLILGLGIGMTEVEETLLQEQFGHDRYISCSSPEELPGKVGAVLKAVMGV